MTVFYELHFQCFIGDAEISTANPKALEELRVRYQTRKAFLLSGNAENEAIQLSLFNNGEI